MQVFWACLFLSCDCLQFCLIYCSNKVSMNENKKKSVRRRSVMTPKEFFEFAKKNNAKMADLKFTDLLGTWQHCTFPVEFLDEGAFKEGLGFDGSSIRGWKALHQAGMMGVPALRTVV